MGKLQTVKETKKGKTLDVFSTTVKAGVIEFRLPAAMIDGLNRTVDKKIAAMQDSDDIIYAPLNFGVTAEDDKTIILSSAKIPCWQEIAELPLNAAGENKIFTYADLIRKIKASYGTQKIPENKLPDIKAFFRGLKLFCLIRGHSFSVRVTKNGGFSVKIMEQPFERIPFTCVYKTHTQAEKEAAARKAKFALENGEYLRGIFKEELTAELSGARLAIESGYKQLEEKTRQLNAELANKQLDFETAVDARREQLKAEISALQEQKIETEKTILSMQKSAEQRKKDTPLASVKVKA